MTRIDYGMVDRTILEAIQSHPDVPTPQNLSWRAGGTVPYSVSLIRKRLDPEVNPSLCKALEDRGMKYVHRCSEEIFAKNVGNNKWKKVHPLVRLEIYKRLDGQIWKAIRSFPGAPTPGGLSKSGGGPLSYEDHLIAMRIESNGSLKTALERRGTDYVTGIDTDIRRAIRSFRGVPTPKTLSKTYGGRLPYGIRLVTARFKANPSLGDALAERGAKYVRTCSDKIFTRAVVTCEWNRAHEKVRLEIRKRLDKQIRKAIRAFPDIPTPKTLSKIFGGSLQYSSRLIAECIESSKSLKTALERKGIAYVTGCNHETFVKAVTSGAWNGMRGEVRRAIEKIIDDNDIIPAIRSFPGVPTPKTLSKAHGGSLPYSYDLIDTRIKSNDRLQRALERKGITYVKGLDHETFVKEAASKKWNCVSPAVRSFIVTKIDKEIFREMRSSGRVPSAVSLSKAGGGNLPYGHHLLKRHINHNHGLKKALELKKEGATIPPHIARMATGFYSRNPLALLADALPGQVIPFRPPRRGMAERPQPSVSEMVRRLRTA